MMFITTIATLQANFFSLKLYNVKKVAGTKFVLLFQSRNSTG